MNSNEFKHQIVQFLLELDNRKTDVANGKLECTIRIGKSLYDYAFHNFTKDDFPIVYSSNGVLFDYIFSRKIDNDNINANNYATIVRLVNGIKYQILANKNLYENITPEDFYLVYWGYFTRLSRFYNWTQTMQFEYLTWMDDEDLNVCSNSYIENLYKIIYLIGDKTVISKKGVISEINIKNSAYNTMNQISEDEMLKLINSFSDKPTVKEITELYKTNTSNYITTDSVRRYIKQYKLEYMIKTCKHSKAFKDKQKKKKFNK